MSEKETYQNHKMHTKTEELLGWRFGGEREVWEDEKTKTVERD